MLIAYTHRVDRQGISDRLYQYALVHWHEHLYTMRMHRFQIKLQFLHNNFVNFC